MEADLLDALDALVAEDDLREDGTEDPRIVEPIRAEECDQLALGHPRRIDLVAEHRARLPPEVRRHRAAEVAPDEVAQPVEDRGARVQLDRS
jgi:hypothetical protein